MQSGIHLGKSRPPVEESGQSDGVDGSVFEAIEKAVAADRYAFFTEFFKNFYNLDVLLGKRVSEQTVQASWNVAADASATASLACVATWHEDFRKDLAPDPSKSGATPGGGSLARLSRRSAPP
jgi:hypothetical protein